MRTIFTALVLVLVYSLPAHAGQMEEGKEALELPDYQMALKLLQPLADQGNAEAQYWLGEMYSNGEGVKKDKAEAEKWYRQAIQSLHSLGDRGTAEEQYYVSSMYYSGEGVKADFAEAEKWLRMAAEHGDFTAQSKLASLYELGQIAPPDLKRGEVVKPDWVQAYKWNYLAGGDTWMTRNDAKRMTPEQIAEAKRLIAQWWRSHPATASKQ